MYETHDAHVEMYQAWKLCSRLPSQQGRLPHHDVHPVIKAWFDELIVLPARQVIEPSSHDEAGSLREKHELPYFCNSSGIYMNKEETLALYKKGRAAWNAWAKEMLDQQIKLKETGEWMTEYDFATHKLLGENLATQNWLAAAKSDCTKRNFENKMDFTDLYSQETQNLLERRLTAMRSSGERGSAVMQISRNQRSEATRSSGRRSSAEMRCS